MTSEKLRLVLPMPHFAHETYWEIRGERYVARFWSSAQWARTPEDDRPSSAQPVGDVGWLDIQFAPH